MTTFRQFLLTTTCTVLACAAHADQSPTIPRTPPELPPLFPRFVVPGHEREMQLLEELFYLHFRGAHLGATFSAHWLAQSLLWPAIPAYHGLHQRNYIRSQLLNYRISPHGYVSCHQHEGLGHPEGWPFPFYAQSGGAGWQFIPHPIPDLSLPTSDLSSFRLRGCRALSFNPSNGWSLAILSPTAALEFPSLSVHGVVASFFLIRWSLANVPRGASCFLEFRANKQRHFSHLQRVPVPLYDSSQQFVNVWLELLGHPRWKTNDILTGLRLVFINATGAVVTFAHACTAVDTRHNVNNAIFIDAAYSYATWTGDTNFLAIIIPRLRKALSYALSEFRVPQYNCVYTPWLGHDGTSGIYYDKHGVKHIRYGYGIGNNYFDLLPFGGKDAYATVYLFTALKKMAALERAVAAHPPWHIPPPPPHLTPDRLLRIAHALKSANTQFWNAATARFATLDLNSRMYDYGFTFLNCEAVAADFATPAQAEAIMQWLEGSRIITNDTSHGPDIYHWEFAPRATTKRNTDYYNYAWTHPEVIPFGGQIQDGGAVLGFAYHDLMTRLITRGPDNAWQRLKAILAWFDRVQSEGGYRAYYKDNNPLARGSLQGCGTAGGLGLDCEFLESVLVPQIMLYGFLGFQPHMDGFTLHPRLPSSWPSLTISNIFFQGAILHITASSNSFVYISTNHPPFLTP